MEDHAYVVNVDGTVVQDGEYLLIERGATKEHASGLLAFPGGRVEQPPGKDDTIEETARRELSEEVGIEVGAVEYIHSTTFESDRGRRCLNIVTLCEHRSGNATPNAPEEVAAVHWLTPDEISEHDAAPGFIGGTGAIPRRSRRGYTPSLLETVHRLHHCWIFRNI